MAYLMTFVMQIKGIARIPLAKLCAILHRALWPWRETQKCSTYQQEKPSAPAEGGKARGQAGLQQLLCKPQGGRPQILHGGRAGSCPSLSGSRNPLNSPFWKATITSPFSLKEQVKRMEILNLSSFQLEGIEMFISGCYH